MPNHCINVVIAEGIKHWDIFRKLETRIEELNGFDIIDFEKIIPPILGNPDWYNWNIKNWGTKWNAYYSLSYPAGSEWSEKNNVIFFETAWSPAYPIIEELSKTHKDIPIVHESTDEFFQWFERDIWLNGERINHEYVDCQDFSKIDEEKAKGLWEVAGVPKDDWYTGEEEPNDV